MSNRAPKRRFKRVQLTARSFLRFTLQSTNHSDIKICRIQIDNRVRALHAHEKTNKTSIRALWQAQRNTPRRYS